MLSKIRRETVLDIVYNGIFLLVLYVLQAGVFPWFAEGAVPLLLVIAAAGLSHFTDSGRGAVLGLFCGILCDVALGRPTIIYTVTLSIIGLFLGYLGDTILSRRFPSYLICCLGALVVVSFVQMFALLFFEDVAIFPLLITAVIQIVTSMVCAVLLYPVIKWISRKSRR
ncbi:MAG: hypothetical protein IJ017_02135 [Oscillospiraceae bacterium]|nr:hypothetical protein [Oscillospiraceae bacterium]